MGDELERPYAFDSFDQTQLAMTQSGCVHMNEVPYGVLLVILTPEKIRGNARCPQEQAASGKCKIFMRLCHCGSMSAVTEFQAVIFTSFV